jgi:threonyl-tRNA synthetase
MGDLETWNRAEKELAEILKDSGVEFFIGEGDGAFYGPKADILMTDCMGREWQTGTIQLDFQLPKNFDLKYADKDAQEFYEFLQSPNGGGVTKENSVLILNDQATRE